MQKRKRKKLRIQPQKALNKAVKEINNSQSTKEMKADVRLLFRMLRDWRNKEYTLLSASTIIIVIGAALYILSPIDIIPESIPVVGRIDDLSVLAYALHAIGEELKNYRLWLDTKDMRADEAISHIESELKKDKKRRTQTRK